MRTTYLILSIFLLYSLSVRAQRAASDSLTVETDTIVVEEGKKAWELGVGGTVFQFSRVGFSNFTQTDNGYAFDLDLNHAV